MNVIPVTIDGVTVYVEIDKTASISPPKVTAHGVGLAAAQDANISRISSNFSGICGYFKLIARKIRTWKDRKADPVSSYRLRDLGKEGLRV